MKKDPNERIARNIAGLIVALCALIGACSNIAVRKIVAPPDQSSQGH